MAEHGADGNEGYCRCGYYMAWRLGRRVCVPELQEKLARTQEIAEALADDYGIEHTYKCVQFGKPLMEQMIGGDVPCTCGLSALVNELRA